MCSILLLPYEDGSDIRIVKLVKKRTYYCSGISEHYLNVLFLKTFYHNFG